MGSKVGDKREAEGLTWTFYRNQFGESWKAGPLALNVVIPDASENRDQPYRVGGVYYATFEKAASTASTAKQQARKAYDAAVKLVREYEQAENKNG